MICFEIMFVIWLGMPTLPPRWGGSFLDRYPGLKPRAESCHPFGIKSDEPYGKPFRFEKFAYASYRGTYVPMSTPGHPPHLEVERVQTGVRLEKRLLKVLKAVAELKDMSLGDLLEGIVLHAFEGKSAFTRETLKEIEQLKTIYGLTLAAEDSHKLKERSR
jgi:hypothetical protein